MTWTELITILALKFLAGTIGDEANALATQILDQEVESPTGDEVDVDALEWIELFRLERN